MAAALQYAWLAVQPQLLLPRLQLQPTAFPLKTATIITDAPLLPCVAGGGVFVRGGLKYTRATFQLGALSTLPYKGAPPACGGSECVVNPRLDWHSSDCGGLLG